MAHTQRREARQIKREGILGRIAGGNHLTAENDEPDSVAGFTEAELLAGDMERMQRREERFRQQLAVVHEMELAAFRRAGWL